MCTVALSFLPYTAGKQQLDEGMPKIRHFNTSKRSQRDNHFTTYYIIGHSNTIHYTSGQITKVLTIEASGIAVAASVARCFGVPMVFAKKTKSLNLGDDVYSSRVSSYTHGIDYDVTVSREYLDNNDTVLLIDDFLAVGNAMKGLLEICDQARAHVAGIGICIEKGFQQGGEDLRMMGIDVMSLAIIESMSEDGTITFTKQDD